MSHRSTHYWLWFLLFGVIGGLLNFFKYKGLDGESLWLLISGGVGLVVGAKWLNEGKLARIYDLIVGIIFAAAGIIGILLGFGVHIWPSSGLLSGAITDTTLLGLSLAIFPSLINTVLGFTSFNHGIRTAK